MMPRFDYPTAFARNRGWVTVSEQTVLRAKRVAIAGLGGVGGSHLLTLARLGVGAVHIADFDHFELANFNRQAGAFMSTLGQPKIEVLARMARDINPELDLRLFPEGVNPDNLDAFLADVDLYLDALDFFALAPRRAVFAACHAHGIPAVTAAPIGMSAALLSFLPGGMSFEDYFGLEGQPEHEQYLRFLVGLTPAALHRGYLVDPTAVDLATHRSASTPMSCELCAGVAGSEVLKILLGRGEVRAVPHALQFDAYTQRLRRTWRPGGHRHPLQRLTLALARRQLARAPRAGTPSPQPDAVRRILDLARFAPSGDNTQPWRFEISGEHGFVVHGRDTREHCVYDLAGHASQTALGGLLETIRIAASTESLRADWRLRSEGDAARPTFDVTLKPDEDLAPDALAPYIRVRSVQRRALRTRALAAREREALTAVLGPDHRVAWLEGWDGRRSATRVTWASAGLRLTLREAQPVHRDVIDWTRDDSPDRIPAAAVGLDPVALKMTRWTLAKWERVAFMNRYLAGTLLPRVELDLIPGLFCAAHFLIVASQPPQSIEDYLAAGAAMQRFWLTAARLGLFVQPEMTPLIFAEYVRDGVRFSADEAAYARAGRVSELLRDAWGEAAARGVFMGRIGAGPAPRARSMRRPLDELLIPGP
jgi:molybdopterin/thiamine biosynthesis adenylyltransferase